MLLQCLLLQFIYTLMSLLQALLQALFQALLQALVQALLQADEAAMHGLAGNEQLPNLPADVYKGLAIGTQVVSKGRQGPEAANEVQVNLICLS